VSLVADRLHSAAIHLLRWVRQVDPAQGLTAARLSALSVLVFAGPHTVGGLADAEQVTAATMSKLLDHLEADGLCRRARSPDDRRAIVVSATAAGKRLLGAARRERVDRLSSRLRRLVPGDLATLHAGAELIERLVAGEPMRNGPAAAPELTPSHAR
jgi:DNA-binding MarR family transcriptional regulator